MAPPAPRPFGELRAGLRGSQRLPPKVGGSAGCFHWIGTNSEAEARSVRFLTARKGEVVQEYPASEAHALPLRRWLGLGLLALLIGVGLIIALLFGLRTVARSQAPIVTAGACAAAPTGVHPAAPIPSPSAIAGAMRPTAQPPQSVPAPIPTDAIALVNGLAISQEAARVAQAADRAMAVLLDQTAPAPNDLLERLINMELVRETAQAASFTLQDGQIDQALTVFLASKGKTLTDLERALAASNLDADDFRAYFGQLILVDEFSRAQALAAGTTVPAYLKRLQVAARISLGPAAAQIALVPTAAAPALAFPSPEATPGAHARTNGRNTPRHRPRPTRTRFQAAGAQ